MTGPLRLLARDNEDLAVISAALQDAVTRVEDIAFEKRGRRLTIAFNRFCWESRRGERVRCGLQIGDVLEVRSRGLERDNPDQVLELLALGFEPAEAPGGRLTLAFAGGADLAVEVECVDAALADVGDAWRSAHRPRHVT